MKKLMEMVEKQRQAWEEQQREQWHGGQDDTVGPSHHHSSKDTTASSCDPASLSVATASSRLVTVLCFVYSLMLQTK